MAVAFRSAASADNASSTNHTVTKPAGVVSGDVLLAILTFNANAVTVTPPAGWTLVDALDDTGHAQHSHVFHRVAGGSEPSSWTFTTSGAVASTTSATAWTGVDTTTPIDAHATNLIAATTKPLLALPALTTTVANAMLVGVAAAKKASAAVTFTPPDSRATAQILTTSYQAGTVNSSDRYSMERIGRYADLWAFDVATSGTLSIRSATSGGGFSDSYMILYDSSLAVVAQDDDSAGSNFPLISSVSVTPGRYWVELLGRSVGGTGSYQIRAELGTATLDSTTLAAALDMTEVVDHQYLVGGTQDLAHTVAYQAQASAGAAAVGQFVASEQCSGTTFLVALTPLLPTTQTVTPSSIASEEAVGSPTVTQPQTVSPTSIASEEAVGAPTVTTSATVAPGSIASGESVGAPSVTQINPTPELDRWSDSAGLAFTLTDLWRPDGAGGWATRARQVARFTDYESSQVVIPRAVGGGQRTARVTVSIHDPIVAYAQPYRWMLKATWHGRVVFWGPLTRPEISTETDTVTFNAVDPSLRCVSHFVRIGDQVLNSTGGDPPNPFNEKRPENPHEGWVPASGQGYRMLIDCAQLSTDQALQYPPLGIVYGHDDGPVLESDTNLKAAFGRGAPVWESIGSLSENQVAPEFELAPTDAIEGAYAVLCVYERQGEYDAISDTTYTPRRVVFHAGFGKDNAHITHTPGGTLVTHAHVLSQDGKHRVSRVARDAATLYGVYVDWKASDHNFPATSNELLRGVGDQILDAYSTPPNFLTITPKVDAEYLYLRDFIIGSEILVAIRRGEHQFASVARVTTVRLTQEGQAGAVVQELDIVPAVIADADDEES